MRTLVAPRAATPWSAAARALSNKSAASKRSPASHADKQHAERLMKRKPLPPPGRDPPQGTATQGAWAGSNSTAHLA